MLAVGNVEKKMDLYFVSKANTLKKKPNQRKQDLEKTGRNNTLIARKTKKDSLRKCKLQLLQLFACFNILL